MALWGAARHRLGPGPGWRGCNSAGSLCAAASWWRRPGCSPPHTASRGRSGSQPPDQPESPTWGPTPPKSLNDTSEGWSLLPPGGGSPLSGSPASRRRRREARVRISRGAPPISLPPGGKTVRRARSLGGARGRRVESPGKLLHPCPGYHPPLISQSPERASMDGEAGRGAIGGTRGGGAGESHLAPP